MGGATFIPGQFPGDLTERPGLGTQQPHSSVCSLGAWACLPRLAPGQQPGCSTELDQQLAVVPALVGGQSQAQAHVMIFHGLFLESWAGVSVRGGTQLRRAGLKDCLQE